MQRATSIFYGLSGFALLMALFVMQPSRVSEVTALQHEMSTQFSVALQQTFGDQSYFSDVWDVVDGVTAFYDQSTDATVALLTQPESDQDIIYVFKTVYLTFADAVSGQHGEVAGVQTISPDNFMKEPAIYNILPSNETPNVAGISVFNTDNQPVNTEKPWVTIQDNFTGQKYCLAIYNGEVNKYLGACKYDYH